MAQLDQRAILGAAVLTAAGLFFWAGTRLAGGTGSPGTTESNSGGPTPVAGAPVLQASEHVGAVIYTAHRYPRMCGQEFTTLMHRGWSVADIPRDDETLWMTRPPSELVL